MRVDGIGESGITNMRVVSAKSEMLRTLMSNMPSVLN